MNFVKKWLMPLTMEILQPVTMLFYMRCSLLRKVSIIVDYDRNLNKGNSRP